jgi:hypothetical protein
MKPTLIQKKNCFCKQNYYSHAHKIWPLLDVCPPRPAHNMILTFPLPDAITKPER